MYGKTTHTHTRARTHARTRTRAHTHTHTHKGITTNTCSLGTSEVHLLEEDRAGLGSSNSDERAVRYAGWYQQ